MAESFGFDIDRVNRTTVTVDGDTLERYGFESAKELLQAALDAEQDDQKPREYGRGYQGGGSE